MAEIPSVLIVGGAELDACAEVLASVGCDFVRASTLDPSGDECFTWPRDMLVTTPATALSRQRDGTLTDLIAGSTGFAWVCLHDQSLPAFQRRQLLDAGFHYLAQGWQHGRIDRTLLRLLALQLVYEGAERRGEERLICQHPLTYVIGTERRSGRLMDLSAAGLRFMAEQALGRGTELEIYLPAELDLDAPTAFSAVVLRCSIPNRGPGGVKNASVVARFEALSTRQQAQIQAALDKAARRGPVFRQGEPKRRELVLSDVDRRAEARRDCSKQVVVLTSLDDDERYIVRGRDLSLHGMRLASHPYLEVGRRIELRLHAFEEEAPLLLRARVCHETEPGGDLGLTFEDMTPDQRHELSLWIDRLPRLELMAAGAEEPETQVLCALDIEGN